MSDPLHRHERTMYDPTAPPLPALRHARAHTPPALARTGGTPPIVPRVHARLRFIIRASQFIACWCRHADRLFLLLLTPLQSALRELSLSLCRVGCPQARPAGFIAAFLIMWGLVFANRFLVYIKQSELETAVKEWVQCLLTGAPRGQVCPPRPSAYPEFWYPSPHSTLVPAFLWLSLHLPDPVLSPPSPCTHTHPQAIHDVPVGRLWSVELLPVRHHHRVHSHLVQSADR
jgi:hypothetical protein